MQCTSLSPYACLSLLSFNPVAFVARNTYDKKYLAVVHKKLGVINEHSVCMSRIMDCLRYHYHFVNI
jgi:hypothetical protein